jgi:hypothetical protein
MASITRRRRLVPLDNGPVSEEVEPSYPTRHRQMVSFMASAKTLCRSSSSVNFSTASTPVFLTGRSEAIRKPSRPVMVAVDDLPKSLLEKSRAFH